jgi:Putative zinc-finger
MDHAYIEEHGLIERYHRGLLDPEEEARFEEHYFSCPQCMEQLELARGFQRGLQAATAEDAARAALGAGLFAWLARRGRLAQLGLTLAVLLAAATLPALWLLGENRELRQARQEQTEQQRQTEAARRDAEARLAASERQRKAERRDLEQRLAQTQRPSGPASETARPLVPTVLLLTVLRGEPGEPAATFHRGSPVTLAVDAGSDAGFASYRVTVTGAGGRTLFRQDGLKPNALEVLMVTFPAGFFPPGDYRLTVEGLRSGGEAADLGGSPFRVAP